MLLTPQLVWFIVLCLWTRSLLVWAAWSLCGYRRREDGRRACLSCASVVYCEIAPYIFLETLDNNFLTISAHLRASTRHEMTNSVLRKSAFAYFLLFNKTVIIAVSSKTSKPCSRRVRFDSFIFNVPHLKDWIMYPQTILWLLARQARKRSNGSSRGTGVASSTDYRILHQQRRQKGVFART